MSILRTVRTLNHPLLSPLRLFSTSIYTCQQHSTPLTSQKLKFDELEDNQTLPERFSGTENGSLMVKLLAEIAQDPVLEPTTPFVDLKVAPKRVFLPRVPVSVTAQSMNFYLNGLTTFKYNDATSETIESSITAVLESAPELITKNTFLNIANYYQFNAQHYKLSQLMKLMTQKTDIPKDVDFYNILLGYNRGLISLQPRVERLQRMKEEGIKPNHNTFYSVSSVLKSHENRLELIKLMTKHHVPHGPILRSATYTLCQELSPLELLEYLRDHGITKKNMSIYYLNCLIFNHLRHSNVHESWSTAMEYHSDSDCPAKLNISAFMIYNQYFIDNNELHNCFAMYNKFLDLTGTISKFSIALGFTTKHLVRCKWFDNWGVLTRSLVKEIQKSREGLKGDVAESLNDYARLHNIEDFDLFGCTASDTEFLDNLLRKLRWNNGEMLLNLEDNNEEFIEAARLLVASPQPAQTLDPTDLL